MKFFKNIGFGGTNPHYKIVKEYQRVTNPLGNLDAVLILQGGNNYKLYIVNNRQPTNNKESIVIFVHCNDFKPEIKWINNTNILCKNNCRDIINQSGCNIHNVDQATIIQLKDDLMR